MERILSSISRSVRVLKDGTYCFGNWSGFLVRSARFRQQFATDSQGLLCSFFSFLRKKKQRGGGVDSEILSEDSPGFSLRVS